MAKDAISVDIPFLNSTPGTHRYGFTKAELSAMPSEPPTTGIYIRKTAFEGAEPPQTIRVTIEAA